MAKIQGTSSFGQQNLRLGRSEGLSDFAKNLARQTTGNLRRAPDGNIEDLYCELVMTLPLREYLPAYALLVGGPLTAGMVYIAGKAFKKPLSKLSSGKWKILGTLSNPETEFIEWFE